MPAAPLDFARERPIGAVLLLVLAGLLVAHAVTFVRRPIDAWGYDESTHVELPAARLVLAQGLGDRLEVVNSCDRYPPAVPLYQAAVQGVFGLEEGVARRAAFGAWFFAGLFGLAVLGRGLARRLGLPGELALVMLLFAALSPLVWRFAPTLFLEVPFLVVATWTLVAWFARQGSSQAWSKRRELIAGACVTAAFFTKFNYGLQLGAALGLDWLLETLGEARRGRWREQLRRSGWLAAPALVAFFLWFIYPPGGVLEGETHWEAFRAYLSGNMQLGETSQTLRLLHWGIGAFAHPVWFAAAVVGVGFALVRRTVDASGKLPPPLRCLWLVLALLLVPPALHPFHLDRFLIPVLLPVWALAAVGSTALLVRPRAFSVALGACVVTALILPRHRWAGALGFLGDDPAERAFQLETCDEIWSLFGQVPTGGLSRPTHDRLADLVAGVVGPEEHVAWIGMSPEFCPAALHLALLDRGGGRARFLADAHERMDILPTAGAPAPEVGRDARLRRVADLADAADVILMTAPSDLKERPRPQFPERWQAPVVELGWKPTEVGRVQVVRPERDDLEVILFALRPGAAVEDG